MELSKSQTSELYHIGKNMPVFAGNIQSKQDAQDLIDFGLAMRYEGEYVLTEKGKEELNRRKLEGAKILAEQSSVNEWALHHSVNRSIN